MLELYLRYWRHLRVAFNPCLTLRATNLCSHDRRSYTFYLPLLLTVSNFAAASVLRMDQFARSTGIVDPVCGVKMENIEPNAEAK